MIVTWGDKVPAEFRVEAGAGAVLLVLNVYVSVVLKSMLSYR